MQEEDYESKDESEACFERELERLEHEPSYMHESWEEFCTAPSVILAKRLWLKYTILGESVPDNVTRQMIAIIKKQVEDQELNRNPDTYNTVWRDNELYRLLHIAKTNPNLFWQILHEPQAVNFLRLLCLDVDVLEKLRGWLPEQKKFKPNELYSIFESLMRGDDDPPIGPPYYSTNKIDQRYRKRFPKKNMGNTS